MNVLNVLHVVHQLHVVNSRLGAHRGASSISTFRNTSLRYINNIFTVIALLNANRHRNIGRRECQRWCTVSKVRQGDISTLHISVRIN
jgi:hypothetical protein